MKKYIPHILLASLSMTLPLFAAEKEPLPEGMVVVKWTDNKGTYHEELVKLPEGATAEEFALTVEAKNPEPSTGNLQLETPPTHVSFEPVPFLETGVAGVQLRFSFGSFKDFRLMPAMIADKATGKTGFQIEQELMVASTEDPDIPADVVNAIAARVAAADYESQDNAWTSAWGVGGAITGSVAIVYLLRDSGGDSVSLEAGGDIINNQGTGSAFKDASQNTPATANP